MATAVHHALMKHNKHTPRYTSYPTAPHFKANFAPNTHKAWLSTAGTKTVSLYIHIPFCHKICWYCGCHTKAAAQYDPIRHYLANLTKEIELISGIIGKETAVSHIHFGGGSPSYLSSQDFSSLMAHIRQYFTVLPTAEIAIELDPREVTEAKVAAYCLAGVNRASLGVQDFHKPVQQAINRLQPYHIIYDSVRLLKDYGITAYNMDLLYGLPYQTEALITDNITLAASMGPARISLFGYAHVPWMKKHMRLIDETKLPNPAERIAQFEAAQKALYLLGYRQIGLDHFVRPDDPMAIAYDQKRLHRNFQGYTTDRANSLIGFGTSAISSLPAGYVQNTSDNRKYFKALDAGILPTAKGIMLSDKDKIHRAIIEEIMCYNAFDLQAFCRTLKDTETALAEHAFQVATNSLQELAADHLIIMNTEQKSLKLLSPQASRLVAAAFDTYLNPATARHSQVA